jgi:hypothetical protein
VVAGVLVKMVNRDLPVVLVLVVAGHQMEQVLLEQPDKEIAAAMVLALTAVAAVVLVGLAGLEHLGREPLVQALLLLYQVHP